MPNPTRPTDRRRLLGEWTWRWALVLSLLVLSSLSQYAVFRRQVSVLRASSELVDLSGRQRVVTQRAALLALRMADEKEPQAVATLRRELLEIIASIEETQRVLTARRSSMASGDPARERLEAVFLEPPHYLDRRCREFVSALEVVAASSGGDRRALAEVVSMAEGHRLLAALDALTAELRHTAEHRVAWLARIELALSVLTLLAIVAMGLLIFRPLVRRTRRYLRELRLTLDNDLTGIAAVDPSGRLIAANQALCAMTGVDRRALLGRDWLRLVHPEDRVQLEERWRRVWQRRGEDTRALVRLVAASGDTLEGMSRLGVVLDDQGRPGRMLFHFEDWTDRLRAESEAREDRARLAHVSRLSVMGEMAGGIAHEINQPLTAISNYAAACRRLGEAGQLRNAELLSTLDKIAGQARRAGEVIRRLREFVRRRETRLELVDLNRAVEEALSLAQADARLRGCRIEARLEEVPPVVADPVQLQQVVVNLVRNAIESEREAETKGGGELTVATRRLADERVQVSIRDRGQGLPADAEGLFEPFYTTKQTGLGMGLSISRSIVRAHGGRLWCEPAPDGPGAVFHFTLPAAIEGTRLKAS